MSLLLPEAGLLFWMLLSFSVVFFLVAKFGFPIILRQAEERKAFIDQSLKNAREANEKLEQINESAQHILMEAKTQQQSILRNAEEDRKKIMEQAQREAKKYADEQLAQLQARLEDERRKSVETLRGEVVSLSVDMAEQLLRRQLSDKAAQMDLIEKMLDEQTTNVMKN